MKLSYKEIIKLKVQMNIIGAVFFAKKAIFIQNKTD